MSQINSQRTIKAPVSCYGVGIHSGRNTQVTLRPAESNTGIIFIRTDITDRDNIINASYKNVFETTMSTAICNEAKVSVSTIEHLMAAIWGLKIDNLIIEIDGPEVPIMDGSSKAFVFMLLYSGCKVQKAPKHFIKLLKEIYVSDNGSEIMAAPCDHLNIESSIIFNNKVIGQQAHHLSQNTDFCSEIADARTFGFLKDLDYLQSRGLAKGASLDNAIGIDEDNILNHDGLRYKNEFARHKLLDMLGDLMCAGNGILADIKAHKTSHNLNNQFLHKIFSDHNAYEIISANSAAH
jgi:UDP-3-O-[3-hydroxymyristoyl] N-acetylglucosamine deacetylase